MSARAWQGVAVALLPAVAWATATRALSLEQRTQHADRVVLAQVLESRTEVPDGDVERMRTLTRVVVGEEWKGKGLERLEIVQPGGRFGLWESHRPGDPAFTPGETVVLFLVCPPQWGPGRCRLLGLADGKLPVIGQDVMVGSVATGRWERRPLLDLARQVQQAQRHPPPASTEVQP